jgi:hypothetical protein
MAGNVLGTKFFRYKVIKTTFMTRVTPDRVPEIKTGKSVPEW